MSYKDALMCKVNHKNRIKEVNALIKSSLHRKCISEIGETNEENDSWFTFIVTQPKYISVKFLFCEDDLLTFTAHFCTVCGGYIKRYNKIGPKRLCKYIYCDNIEHHDKVYKENSIRRRVYS
jgi:hypothetical protein